jgi:hypothetical protein
MAISCTLFKQLSRMMSALNRPKAALNTLPDAVQLVELLLKVITCSSSLTRHFTLNLFKLKSIMRERSVDRTN